MNDLISQFFEFLVIGLFGIILFELLFLGKKKLLLIDSITARFITDKKYSLPQLEAYKAKVEAAKQSPAWLEQVKLWFFPIVVLMIAYKIFFNQESINFPLYLVLAVFATGMISLLDVLFLKARRVATVKKLAAVPEDVTEGQELEQSVSRELSSVEYSKSFFPVLLLVLVLRSFLVEPFQIPSTSMVPTLAVGDFILVNKFTYGIRLPVVRTKVIDVTKPERGDVMVFFPPHEKRYFIKRVIGLPGDRIDYVDKQLFINGEKIPERLQAQLPANRPLFEVYEETLGTKVHQIRKDLYPVAHIERRGLVVPPGHYYMMGDNRDNSSDSRIWGFVPEENIVGEAFAIWMHWKGFGSWPDLSRIGGIE